MIELQKTQITQMRMNGMSYGQISRATAIPASTVRSFCWRHDIKVDAAVNAEGYTPCQFCGKPVKQDIKRKLKKFCSDRCRNRWWSNNMDKVNRKAYYDTVCVGCGKTFKAYGNAHRKYCSHDCYILDRFGGVSDEQG